jgi:general secretion pathway protein K
MRETRETDQAKDSSDSAFVLISAIWIAGLLAVIASAFAINLRVQILSGANVVQSAKAELIADGLVNLTAFRLAAENEPDPNLPRNGQAWTCQWDENAVAQLAVQDQGGLIDLNAASGELLSQLVEHVGLKDNAVQPLVTAIQDYRDSDHDAADGGSEPDSYPGVSFGPKNAPFQAVEELDQIPGMNDKLYDSLSPFVTVQSLQPGFDPKLMPAQLKELLGVNADGTVPSPLQPFVAQSHGSVFSIDATVRLQNGTVFQRHAVISMIKQPDRPFMISSWQRGRNVEVGPVAVAAKSCLN